MKKSAICLGLALIIAVISAHQYDSSSCKTLLPVLKRASLLNTSEKTTSAVVEPISSEETTEDNDDDDDDDNEDEKEYSPVDLVPALERSPYKIQTSNLKYGRNKVMTIKIEGSKLNGILLQARQRLPSSLSNKPTFIGNFIDLPEGFQTMDCNPLKTQYKSNTVYNTHQRIKSSIKLNWKAPNDTFDTIEFLATIIRGKYYWTHVRSMPIFFNEFPPSFEGCGKSRYCHQHLKNADKCEDGFCKDYVLMIEVSDNFITFFIGGEVKGDTGYVGIAFTEEKEKLTDLDLIVCRKKDQRTVDVVSYRVNKSVGHLVRQPNVFEEVAYDIEGDYVWCSFRYTLDSQDETSGIDLSKELFYILIRGPLDPMTTDPFLPNEEDMVKEIMKWPAKGSNDIISSYYGGALVVRLSWTLAFIIFLLNVLRLTQ